MKIDLKENKKGREKIQECKEQMENENIEQKKKKKKRSNFN